jgi:hypothetical protein
VLAGCHGGFSHNLPRRTPKPSLGNVRRAPPTRQPVRTLVAWGLKYVPMPTMWNDGAATSLRTVRKRQAGLLRYSSTTAACRSRSGLVAGCNTR